MTRFFDSLKGSPSYGRGAFALIRLALAGDARATFPRGEGFMRTPGDTER